jgi:hypothetical protein
MLLSGSRGAYCAAVPVEGLMSSCCIHNPDDSIDPHGVVSRSSRQLLKQSIVLTAEKHNRFISIPFAIQVGFFEDIDEFPITSMVRYSTCGNNSNK